MTHLRLAIQLAAATLLLTLCACGSQPPWVLHESANSVTLRWYADTTPASDANLVAARYCAAVGKTAGIGQIQRDGSAAVGEYRCVE